MPPIITDTPASATFFQFADVFIHTYIISVDFTLTTGVLGPVKKIVDVRLAIKKAVDTAKLNERVYRPIVSTVAYVYGSCSCSV